LRVALSLSLFDVRQKAIQLMRFVVMNASLSQLLFTNRNGIQGSAALSQESYRFFQDGGAIGEFLTCH
jgi:hypothetical protein